MFAADLQTYLVFKAKKIFHFIILIFETLQFWFLRNFCRINQFRAIEPLNLKNQMGTKKNYFLVCNKKSRFDFADELKIGDVRYKHLTQITIKVQLFWRLSYEM